MKIIQNNAVELFLKENPNTIYSLKKIRYKLNLSKKHAFFLAKNSKKIRQVNPIEVGSMRRILYTFKYNNVPDVVCDINIVNNNINENENIIDNENINDNINENKDIIDKKN